MKKIDRQFAFMTTGIIFTLITIPYIYLISMLNTKFLAFRFYSFISPLVFIIFISPLIILRKIKPKNIILVGLSIILVSGYINGIYNQFNLRGKPDLDIKNADLTLMTNINNQCLKKKHNIDIDFGGHWNQLWSTYLLKNCDLSLTMPTEKHILNPGYNPLDHLFLAEGVSDYSLIYKTDQDYYPIYKQGEKFQIVDLNKTENLLTFQGNTYGQEFGMFNKNYPFYWLGEEGEYFIKIYSPEKGMRPVTINLYSRETGSLKINLNQNKNYLAEYNFDQPETINDKIEANFKQGWNYLIIDNQIKCSRPETDTRCLSTAVQVN